MKTKLWVAQFNQENGSDESIVLFTTKPTDYELANYCARGQTLESVYELEQTGGPRLSGLPTERALIAEL